MNNESQKPEVIEPEVFMPGNSRPVEQYQSGAQAAGSVLGRFVRAVFTLAVTAVTFFIFAAVLIVLAIPMLIMALFGKKPNIKIFKYKI